MTLGCGEGEDRHDDASQSESSVIPPTTQPSPKNPGEAADGYPLATCVVSGERLNGMGDIVVIQHEGQEVRFCCESCIEMFNEDPSKYLAVLNQVAKPDHESEVGDIDGHGTDHHDHGEHHH